MSQVKDSAAAVFYAELEPEVCCWLDAAYAFYNERERQSAYLKGMPEVDGSASAFFERYFLSEPVSLVELFANLRLIAEFTIREARDANINYQTVRERAEKLLQWVEEQEACVRRR